MTATSVLNMRRQLAEQYIEQLIALLDQLDDDPDFEEDIPDEEDDPLELNGDEYDMNGDEQDYSTDEREACGVMLMGGSAP